METHSEHSAELRVALIGAPTGQLPADTVSAGVMERTDHLAVHFLRVMITCHRGADSIKWEVKINTPTVPKKISFQYTSCLQIHNPVTLTYIH